MVRYQNKQNIKKKLEQNQLLSTRDTSLRTNTVLRIRNQTILKTNMTRLAETTRTKSRLKKKLLVYKKDDKFYINHTVAYSLKLINVRAVMTENPHLVEVGLETLYKFQNNEDIEIEYEELNKEKEVGTRTDKLTDILDELEQGEYGIGIHGIDKGSNEKKQSTASNISSQGLNINNNSKTILSTSISLGMNEDIQQLSQEIMEYKFGNGAKANVVIAVPLHIQNQDGEKIFLGFPDENKRTAGQQYEEYCILDRICAKLKKIPPEFIFGYYCENSDGSENFIRNLKHYSNISQEKREDFFKQLYSKMDDVSKSYNDLIASGNIKQLGQIKERMQRLGWNSYMVDNAITLAQKNEEQAMIQDTGEKKTRQVILDAGQEEEQTSNLEKKGKNIRKVILDNVQQVETSTDINKNKRTRRILIDVCAEVKLSDLSIAKEILRKGLEEQEKNYEGKEV